MKLWGAGRLLRGSNHYGFQVRAATGQHGLAMQHWGPVGSEHNISALNWFIIAYFTTSFFPSVLQSRSAVRSLITIEAVSSPVGGGRCAGGGAGVGPFSSEEAPGSWASRQGTLWRLRRGISEAGVLPAVRPIRPFTGRPAGPVPVAPQANLQQTGVLRR